MIAHEISQTTKIYANENEVRTIIINGFKSAFLSHDKRRELIRQVVNELENEFNFSRHLII